MLDQYAAAMKWFGKQDFEKARPLLEKVAAGGDRELADRARLHLNACHGRTHKAKSPASADECYHHAVVRMNLGQFDEAAELLGKALQAGSHPDYHYLDACLRALTNDNDGALAALKLAIAGDPQCRLMARGDRDFQGLMEDPRFTEILFPERD